MTTDLAIKNYQRLDFFIDQIVTSLETVGEKMNMYFVIAEEEGISQDDAKRYLKSKIPHSTYYKYLPSSVNKRPYEKKVLEDKSPLVDNGDFNTEGMGVVESDSTSETGSDGQEVEREIEQPIVAADSVMLERLKEENKQLRQVISNQQFIKASDIERAVDKQIIILPHNKVLDLCKKRMEMGLNGFMRLESENGIVIGVEVVNAAQA